MFSLTDTFVPDMQTNFLLKFTSLVTEFFFKLNPFIYCNYFPMCCPPPPPVKNQAHAPALQKYTGGEEFPSAVSMFSAAPFTGNGNPQVFSRDFTSCIR